MVIDFHTHAFPDKIAEKTIAILADRSGTAASTDGTVDGLIGSMKDAGVDGSDVEFYIHGQAGPGWTSNLATPNMLSPKE